VRTGLLITWISCSRPRTVAKRRATRRSRNSWPEREPLGARGGAAYSEAEGETRPLTADVYRPFAGAWLVALRAHLLLPAGAEERAEARRDAAALRLADWLERRPQLGRAVFGRGVGEPASDTLPAADVTGLLRACLKLLERPHVWVYRPSPPPLWRVQEALAHMRRLLTELPEGVALGGFLPRTAGEGASTQLQCRAAVAARSSPASSSAARGCSPSINASGLARSGLPRPAQARWAHRHRNGWRSHGLKQVPISSQLALARLSVAVKGRPGHEARSRYRRSQPTIHRR